MTPLRLNSLGLLLLGLASAGPAAADPGYYLVTPYSVPGQIALDLRYWTLKAPGREALLWPEVGLRYGINSRWTSVLFASGIGKSIRSQKLSSSNWQHTVLLTQGQYPVDVAVHAQLIRNHGVGNALEVGPVLQTEVGLTQLNLNLFIEHLRAAGSGSTGLKYQWQVQRRLQPGLRLGVQGFGEFDPWGQAAATPSHRIGPVLRWAPNDKLELNAAYLWGKTYGSRGDLFSAQLLVPF